MSKKSRILNIQKTLTESDNNQNVLFYTPGIKENYELDGYLIDFFVNITMASIDPIPYVEPPQGVGLMNEAEKLKYFNDSILEAPKKILSIYQQVGENSPLILTTEFSFYRDEPSYQEDIFPYLTRTNRIAVAHGTKIFLRVRDFGSGLLGAGDELAFRAVIYEERELDIDLLAQKYFPNQP